MSLPHHLTVRHPALSAWQSAVHQVLARRHGKGLHRTLQHPAMRATNESVCALEAGDFHVFRRRELLDDCARLFAQLVWASFHRDHARSRQLWGELRYLECDPLWMEAWTAYEAARLLHHTRPLYRRHRSMDDFVLALPEHCTVGLLADWGTGTPDARGLLAELATFQPDVLLHLGDIYFSGTPHEVRAHFLDVLDDVFDGLPPVTFSLAGNHDRYSGGAGYLQLLDALGQPASYFCLRNRYWQLLAMDTGLNDGDPLRRGGTLTRLEASEVAWLEDKLRYAGSRGTVLLSHHPYLSFAGTGRESEGRLLAVNPHLRAAFEPWLAKVAWWFWGHEHNLVLYEPYAGLQRGRCIGAAAVPRLKGQQVNAPVPGLSLPQDAGSLPPRRIPGTRLLDDGVEDFHGYAVLELDGPVAVTRYYQRPASALLRGRPVPPTPFFQEEVVARLPDESHPPH